ncbi:Azospirillum phage Cd, Gp10 [Caulobacteraceae bacterium]
MSVAEKIEIRLDVQTNKTSPQSLTSASKEKLRQFVARVENLETERREIADQIKEVFGEAKSLGFDTKALRAVIKLRKQDANDRDEAQMMLDLYVEAIGLD